jgi:hypothetical protein
MSKAELCFNGWVMEMSLATVDAVFVVQSLVPDVIASLSKFTESWLNDGNHVRTVVVLVAKKKAVMGGEVGSGPAR